MEPNNFFRSHRVNRIVDGSERRGGFRVKAVAFCDSERFFFLLLFHHFNPSEYTNGVGAACAHWNDGRMRNECWRSFCSFRSPFSDMKTPADIILSCRGQSETPFKPESESMADGIWLSVGCNATIVAEDGEHIHRNVVDAGLWGHTFL